MIHVRLYVQKLSTETNHEFMQKTVVNHEYLSKEQSIIITGEKVSGFEFPAGQSCTPSDIWSN